MTQPEEQLVPPTPVRKTPERKEKWN